MTPELKAAWVADLRANQNLQATGALQCGERFCCLGRLAVVAGLTIAPDGVYIKSDKGEQAGTYPSLDRQCKVPTDVYIKMNDEHKMTFGEIADFVEANE